MADPTNEQFPHLVKLDNSDPTTAETSITKESVILHVLDNPKLLMLYYAVNPESKLANGAAFGLFTLSLYENYKPENDEK